MKRNIRTKRLPSLPGQHGAAEGAAQVFRIPIAAAEDRLEEVVRQPGATAKKR